MAGLGRDERSWLRAARAGSAADLEALFRAHWPRAYRAAYLVCHDHAAAEDIAQEAFLAAVRGLDAFDAERPFGPWLHRLPPGPGAGPGEGGGPAAPGGRGRGRRPPRRGPRLPAGARAGGAGGPAGAGTAARDHARRRLDRRHGRVAAAPRALRRRLVGPAGPLRRRLGAGDARRPRPGAGP